MIKTFLIACLEINIFINLSPQDARSEAEEQIYKQINDKIDNFMEDCKSLWQNSVMFFWNNCPHISIILFIHNVIKPLWKDTLRNDSYP